MKSLLLIFSIFVVSLCPFSMDKTYENDIEETTLFTNSSTCDYSSAVVNITSKDKTIDSTGVVIAKYGKDYYIATSYQNYKENIIYTVKINTVKLDAKVLGSSKENQLLILQVRSNKELCIVNTNVNDKLFVAKEVEALTNNLNKLKKEQANINYVGACRNCYEETFKNYYYSKVILLDQDNYDGSAIFSKDHNLLGIITNKTPSQRYTYSLVDSNKIYEVLKKLLKYDKYTPNYIKHNLKNVEDLSLHERYLFSLKDNVRSGVIVESVNYLNYFVFGLNQGMVILSVQGEDIYNKYEFDYELSKYEKGSYIKLKVLTIVGLYRTIVVKI